MSDTLSSSLQKLRSQGIRASSSLELICAHFNILLDSSQAQQILSWIEQHGIHSLLSWEVKDVCSFSTLNEDEALIFLAALELGRRVCNAGKGPIEIIHHSKDLFHLFRYLGQEKQEHLCVADLNVKNHVLRKRVVHIGTVNESMANVRDIFGPALHQGVSQIALIHNHPSGDPNPSFQDIQITEQLSKASNILDIDILDHVIIGHHRYFSFRDQGLLK